MSQYTKVCRKRKFLLSFFTSSSSLPPTALLGLCQKSEWVSESMRRCLCSNSHTSLWRERGAALRSGAARRGEEAQRKREREKDRVGSCHGWSFSLVPPWPSLFGPGHKSMPIMNSLVIGKSDMLQYWTCNAVHVCIITVCPSTCFYDMTEFLRPKSATLTFLIPFESHIQSARSVFFFLARHKSRASEQGKFVSCQDKSKKKKRTREDCSSTWD